MIVVKPKQTILTKCVLVILGQVTVYSVEGQFKSKDTAERVKQKISTKKCANQLTLTVCIRRYLFKDRGWEGFLLGRRTDRIT
jgi:hypothetical protein